MTRRALFAALASLPFVPAAVARLKPGRPTTGSTINGVWWPSLDYYLTKHDGVLENARVVVHGDDRITIPFKRMTGCWIMGDPERASRPMISWA